VPWPESLIKLFNKPSVSYHPIESELASILVFDWETLTMRVCRSNPDCH
jgi:hypothetical protein